jgi:hypothetical protein
MVIPAKAGIQGEKGENLDTRLRGYDGSEFIRIIAMKH